MNLLKKRMNVDLIGFIDSLPVLEILSAVIIVLAILFISIYLETRRQKKALEKDRLEIARLSAELSKALSKVAGEEKAQELAPPASQKRVADFAEEHRILNSAVSQYKDEINSHLVSINHDPLCKEDKIDEMIESDVKNIDEVMRKLRLA